MALFKKKRSLSDSGMLGKVVDLATRLQMRHEESLTPGQIETIGTELGLEPAFIQEAIRQVQSKRPPAPPAKRIDPELRSQIEAFAIPIIAGVLAMIAPKTLPFHLFFCVILAIPMSLLVGFLAGNKRFANLAANVLILSLSVSLFMQDGGMGFLYLLFGHSFAKKLADEGLALREKHYPVSDKSENPSVKAEISVAAPVRRSGYVSRQELLDQVMTLQAELARQKQRRTFLSVDVVDSSHLVLSGSELAAEHTFNVFKLWLETIVRRNGGEIQSSAGDGAMCIFTDDASAIRAARQLQQELDQFNLNRNRLPLPFRIRCGISAGSVPIEEGAPIRDIQSPAIYRAAQMQKQAQPGGIVVSEEASAAALQELGSLSLVENSTESAGAFEWRGSERGPNLQGNVQ